MSVTDGPAAGVEAKRSERHLDALHRLTSATARAGDVEEIYAEALDVLLQALGADRAAVLLFDSDGVMRFKAARGLSPEYCSAVEGHSPWSRADTAPQPVLIPAVAADPTLGPLVEIIHREGIEAVAFIPLLYGDRLLGKFMVYYDRSHHFTPAEVDLARTVAGHITFALEKRRLEEELRALSEERGAILNAVGEAITVLSGDGRFVWANEAAAELMGFSSADELLATPVAQVVGRFDLLDHQGGPMPTSQLPGRRALTGEEPPEVLVRWRIKGTGAERWSLVRSRPVLDDEGQVRFSVNVFRDVTERQRAYEAEHQARQAAEAARAEAEASRATLAQALLPAMLTEIPGVELAARYRPATGGVGGDFYDVVALGARRWLAVIGDVCGKGAEAASLTAMARHTLRTLARHHDGPGTILDAANEVMAGQLPEGRFCTAAAAALEPGDDGLQVTVASAGHPVPLVVRGTGEVELLGRAGMLLGVFDELGLVEQDAVLAPGDALVLFTDGCVGEGADSLQVLGAGLAAAAGRSATTLAQVVEAVAIEIEGGHRDDMAILVLKA
jgi:PAS domain S-box-containing protein